MSSVTSCLGESYVEDMRDLCNAVIRNASFGQAPLSLCWPYISSGFAIANPRVLIVGKAVNGHHENAVIRSENGSVTSLLKWSIADREGQIGAPTECEKWLSGPDGAKVRRSPFWQLVSHAYRVVTGNSGEDWWKHAAWTNLYKVAPQAPDDWKESGPVHWLRELQHTPCGEGMPGRVQRLLRMEVDALRPDVVICITGHRGMHHFWHEPEDNPLGLQWTETEPDWRRAPVHKIAKESTGSGQRLWIVTQRPEYRKLVRIVNAFRQTLESASS